mmetsp:Transcript_36354/g.82914  ORF Transcript_36354/g.82914 Transcript_36354/m.82914 type:complete len:483 (+) Transcript_36354:416-1864(+)
MWSVEGIQMMMSLIQNALSRLVKGSVVALVVWGLFWLFFLLEKDNTKDSDRESSEKTNDPADEPDGDSAVEWDADDPFKVLGLSGGIEVNTIEDATRAKRKLALKYHPDRNIDNQEWATRKMQEINDAFARVEKLFEGQDVEDAGQRDEGDSNSVSDSEAETEHERRRREKYERKKRKKDLDDEFKTFKRAQKAAEQERWSKDEFEFEPPRQAVSSSAKRRKPRSKKAKKREAQRRRKQANQKQKRGQVESGQMDTEERPAEETEEMKTPFHRLVVEERFASRFSPELVKHPVFTAIRTHSWSVFQSYYLYGCDSQDEFERDIAGCIKLLYKQTREYVTPLQIACYLGDYEAGTTILSLVGERWKQAVGARSSDESSCLDLAVEALEIAKALVEDASGKLAEAEAGGNAKKIKWASSLCSKYTREMESAEGTVEWIKTLDSHRKNERQRSKPSQKAGSRDEPGLWQKIVTALRHLYIQFGGS